jgi:glucose/arabinose dehydrogenase
MLYGAFYPQLAKETYMQFKRLSIACLGALAIASTSSLLPNAGFAHPVFSPFDNTTFAPITRTGALIALEPIVKGLVSPLKGVVAPGEPDNLYIVEQSGQIWRINIGAGQTFPVDVATPAGQTPFLNVAADLVTLGALGPGTFDERGLLGLAFHPRYQQNGLFYIYMSVPTAGAPTLPTTLPAGSTPNHQNVVVEMRNQGGTVGSARVIWRVDWPQFNHNGGDIAFGPDGMLYIATGDGGGADDRDGQPFFGAPIVGHGLNGNAQNLGVPLGKILRIDVNTRATGKEYGIPGDNPFVARAGALPEIYAYGLRNPYRTSFDRGSGRLFAGDVGQNDIEEVNVIVKGGNYGWNFKEGTLFFDPRGDLDGVAQLTPVAGRAVPPGVIDPIAQYDTHHEGHSVIAGFVYRGRKLHELNGQFIFGDYSRLFNLPSGPHNYGRLFHIDSNGKGGKLRAIREFFITPSNAPNLAVLGFGEDNAGEVYLTGNVAGVPFGKGGVVLRLAPAPKQDRHDEDDD